MKVVITAILRTENRYLEEWLDYHLSLGFDHIYLCDNAENGEERAEDIVADKVKYQNKVTIFPYYNKPGQQVKAYTECYKDSNLDFDWMAFIDIDEFISFPENSKYKTIHDYLSGMNADVILLNWMLYGDNNYVRDDGRGVIERFRKPMPYNYSPLNIWGKSPINRHVKQMLRKGLDLSCVGVHVSDLQKDYKVVNADGEIVSNNALQDHYTFNSCFVRHFITKSMEEFVNTKVKRGRKGDGAPGKYCIEEYFLYNNVSLKTFYHYMKLCKRYNVKPETSCKWWARNIIKTLITPICANRRW